MSNTEKKAFHLTITDNITGEILEDEDIKVFIGGIGYGDTSSSRTLTGCGPIDYAFAIIAAEDAIKDTYEQHPEIKALVSALSMCEGAEENEEEENEE